MSTAVTAQSRSALGAFPQGHVFPSAMINITNRCNLHCEHCFVYRDGNPNEAVDEPTDDELIEQILALKARHHIQGMLWMGGEPMIRQSLLSKGLPLFGTNTITTNGTIPLVDFSEVTGNLLYVVSLDGPEDINDPIRGKGVFQRVLSNISKVPEDFPHTVQCQCVVTKKNQNRLSEFVGILRQSRFDHVTFSFHVPAQNDSTGNAWRNVEERDEAVRIVMDLKEKSEGFVRNRTRSLEMMLSKNNPKKVTDNCYSKRMVMPLYLEGKRLVSPFCCYGNDVDCDRCGAWVVFELAALATDSKALRRFRNAQLQ